MESPPSSFTWSEAFILSDDSGLLLTNSSISSGSMSANGFSGTKQIEDSDCDDKSFSQDDSLDGMSDIMCGENFNTLKKGVHWNNNLKQTSPIEPPLEFQDKPHHFYMEIIDWYAHSLSNEIFLMAVRELKENYSRKIRFLNHLQKPVQLLTRHWNADFLSYSPSHMVRPNSRSSVGSSRLSSSHNSLSLPAAQRVDDSSFITQAVSHDTLSSNQISDLYNVPFDSDMYSLPLDVVKPTLKPKKYLQHKKKRRNTSFQYHELEARHCCLTSSSSKKDCMKMDKGSYTYQKCKKRHSLAGSSTEDGEPIHMTLEEVRHYLHTLYSSSSDSSDHKEIQTKAQPSIIFNNNNKYPTNTKAKTISAKDIRCVDNSIISDNTNNINNNNRSKKNTFLINIKNKKVKDSCDNIGKEIVISSNVVRREEKKKRVHAKFSSFKQALCNIFKFRKISTDNADRRTYCSNDNMLTEGPTIVSRALPPLPSNRAPESTHTSIQRVKDYGWYWGPISSEAAEKILSNEPDGSFIVRDSSDDHYIFSLTFKLNDYVRHVRIDHDQGNFSFGSCTRFKSQTIIEFIENAVEHSRSGRYLFFLHRRPVIGPVRVQLLHPVSRFKQIQSLQHMCRYLE
ncbi:hypothetical protein WA026_018498 [Henosepilachna vigintioctopunctata]|uniref:SH2 domain-containing protein n=1 Tax=Henosepilachna vigintioctopunctata TaxID=420089 RepID=A0AAW1UUM7_9CUCU